LKNRKLKKFLKSKREYDKADKESYDMWYETYNAGNKSFDKKDYNISSSIAGMYDQIPRGGDNYDMDDQGTSNVRTNILTESS
jgi:hypothetical protein